MWVQVLLIAVVFGLVLVLARQKATAISAFKKAGLALFAVAVVVTVLLPELTTIVARALGIGRGTDLVLYALSAAFLVFALAMYIRNQANRALMFALARRVALQEAADAYGLRIRAITPGTAVDPVNDDAS